MTAVGEGTAIITAKIADVEGFEITGSATINVYPAVVMPTSSCGFDSIDLGEPGQQTSFCLWFNDCFGQQWRVDIISNIDGSVISSSWGNVNSVPWWCDVFANLELGEYTANLYVWNDLNNDNVLNPEDEETATCMDSRSFKITGNFHDSGTLDVSSGISGGTTTASLHGINSQGISILLWIFKFDGTWEQLLEIGNNNDDNEVFQYLVYGTIPDFDSESSNVDISQLEGFFTIDSNDWYKDINVILQQGHYFAVVFPIMDNISLDDFLIKEFSVNNGTSGSTPILSTDKADYSPEETVPIAGAGFLANTAYTIVVTRPDGSVVTGDGSFAPGSDIITADNNGNFTYHYKLDGIEGKYLVKAVSSAGNTVAETDFTDSKIMAAPDDSVPAAGLAEGAVRDLAFTGVDPIIPASGAAAAIIGLILIIVSLRNEQKRNWNHTLKYCDRKEA